jgi:hypothetical protein
MHDPKSTDYSSDRLKSDPKAFYIASVALSHISACSKHCFWSREHIRELGTVDYGMDVVGVVCERYNGELKIHIFVKRSEDSYEHKSYEPAIFIGWDRASKLVSILERDGLYER